MGTVTQLNPATAPAEDEAEWMSPADVAKHVPGMTVVNLQELRKKRIGPPYYKPTPKVVIYKRSDIDEWVERSAETVREQP